MYRCLLKSHVKTRVYLLKVLETNNDQYSFEHCPIFCCVEYLNVFSCSAEYVEVEREGKVELYPVS